MPKSAALEHIHAKLTRADEHINHLQAAIHSFRDGTPHRVTVDRDPEAAEAFKRAHQERAVDPRISVVTGDVLYQLRSSLDHLICALVARDGGEPDTAQFPIYLTRPVVRRDVESYQRQVSGITRDAVLAAIERHQPYTRGERAGGHWLAVLKKFSNTDKHRALLLHAVVVRPEVRITFAEDRDGWTLASQGLDDSAQREWPVDRADERVEIVNVQRALTATVAFSKWGDSDQVVDVHRGIVGLRQGVVAVINELAVFLD